MSSNKPKNNEVSQSKINVGNINEEIDVKIYHEFLDEYNKISLSKHSTETLMMIYETGIQLLNDYYIQCPSSSCDSSLIAKFQYTLALINHNINLKNYSEVNARLKETSKLNDDMRATNGKLKNIQKILKEITTTIISIILAVSIIPTAVSALENINSNFVLPVVSTLVLFGMSMILFVYLIHQVNVNKNALIVYIISMATTIVLWLLTWEIDISLKLK